LNQQLEALIPVSIRKEARSDLERLELLLTSLNYFWRGAGKFGVHIVAPDSETRLLKERIACIAPLEKLDICVRSESSVSHILSSVKPEYGVMKQMIIKLSAFNIVKGDYCILFDSDIVACKHFSADDLVINGKVLTEYLTPSMTNWLYESARVLGYALAPGDITKPRMFVTPQIMCKTIQNYTPTPWKSGATPLPNRW
jgi:hypothetical protein